MKRNTFHPISNDQGAATYMAIMVLVALSLTVVMALDSSTINSSMMRRNRDYRDNLYRGESCLAIASENHQIVWLGDTSVLLDVANGDAEVIDQDGQINDTDGNSVRICQYDIARIEDYTDSDINTKLDADALTREFFPMNHTAPPPPGSGDSGKNFNIRRYGIHTRAVDRVGAVTTLTVESGVSKTLNKPI